MFGFLCCNKPLEFTSRDLVNVVQRRVRPAKVGHCGTLDPLAEGVLVVGVGPAVRLTEFVQQQQKHYVADFRLGASSETGDLENGYVDHPELPIPSAEQLESAAKSLVGTIQQTPPAYSAVKVGGRRAYKLARAGQEVEVPARTVRIDQLTILSYDFPNISVDIRCGSGTYVRTLGMDMAKAAGSDAVMTRLVRQAVGPFSLQDAIDIDDLRNQPIGPSLLPASRAVQDLHKVTVTDEESPRLRNGLCLQRSLGLDSSAEVAALSVSGDLIAILIFKKGRWCPKRVFPESGQTLVSSSSS